MELNNPKFVILHCAYTPDSRNRKFTAKDIDQWHKEKGWKGIGYHYFIRGNGDIEMGRAEFEVGAHVKGHNKDTLGVCYDGSYFPTIEQVHSIIILFRKFREKYKIDWADWRGHYEFDSNKECPGFDMEVFRKVLSKIA